MLFLVHRNQIAKQALKSYRKVFDGKVSMGMVTGKYQDYDADFVFATVQTLNKEDTLRRYKKEHWDLIIIETMGDNMKTIRVVAAIIIDNKKVFATQRGHGEFKGGWEFPGGKIDIGETSEEALIREIKEELDTEVEVLELLDTVEYDYPNFHLSMDCFICKIKTGDLVLKEHEAATWLTKDNLYSVEWLPADQELIEKIEKYLKEEQDV